MFTTRVAAALLLSGAMLTSFACARKKHIALHPPAALPASETGLASWYGYPYHGRAAADGEIYDMEKMTAAHRTLPFGTWVRVTNLSNGKTTEVRITDRGPFVDGRVIDLSKAAAREVDLIGPGVAKVRLDIISAPMVAQDLYGVQVGAFQDRARASRVRDAMEKQFGSARIVLRPGKPDLWRVLVGAEPTLDGAQALASRVRVETRESFVVRLDSNILAGSGGSRD
jgi:rare lipoprotein A